jgi:hypothetical protein
MLHYTHAFGPIGRTAIDAADLVLVALAKLAPNHFVAPPALFFSVSWASWASTVSPLSRVDAVERKPCAQWSPPGPVSQPIIRSALFSVLTNIGTPSSLDVQQIADQRRAISAFGVGLAPSATESTPEVVQHEVSVSLGIVGPNGWGTPDKTLPRPRDIM